MNAKRITSMAAGAAWTALLLAVPGAEAASGQLLVGFERGISKERQAGLLSELGGRVTERFAAVRGGRLVVVRPRSGVSVDALRRRLEKSGR